MYVCWIGGGGWVLKHDNMCVSLMIKVLCWCFSVMVQFHALGVLHQIRKSDKLAVTKLVSKLTSSSLRSPYAICLLVGADSSSVILKYV